MDTFRTRFPERKQLVYVFLAFAFASNVWALYDITQEIPAFILRMSLGELLGVISHSLVFSLIDSLFVFFILVLLSVILPASWLRNRFMAIGSAIAILTAVWMMFFHLNNLIGTRNIAGITIWAVSYLIVLAVVYFFIQRSDKLNQGIANFIERLALLAGIYIVLDILGIIVIIVRNIGGVA